MSSETYYLHVKGMYCAGCVARVEKVVSKLEGVNRVNINLATETGKVTFDKNKTSISKIIAAINQIGFEATNADERSIDKNEEIKALRWNFILSAILTFPLAWVMISHFKWATFIYIPPILTNPFFQFIITIPIQFIIGFQFYERAWKAVISGSTNMDVLVVLSTNAAFFYSHYVTFTIWAERPLFQ